MRKSLGSRYWGSDVPWRSVSEGFMTRSNGREVEQSVTVPWRISHVNHEKGDSLNHWQFHTRFEYFVSPSSVLVQGGRKSRRCGCISLTPAAGPIADPFCVTPCHVLPGKTCLQTGRQHSNNPLDTL